jgi:hypothetical protein
MVKGDGHRSRDADRYAFMMENVEEYAQQMKRKHMTYDVLYADYQKATVNPYGYTQFKAIIQEYEKNHDYKYHNVYEPGREMQFDFAGEFLQLVSGGSFLPNPIKPARSRSGKQKNSHRNDDADKRQPEWP